MDSKGLHASAEQAERLHHFAHDLRNRLAGMQQMLRMLASPDPDMDPAELITFADQQYFKAMRLTEELLDDLAIERGTQALATSPLELNKTVKDAIALMGQRLSRKGQSVELSGTDGLFATGEAHHLELLLSALLSNASKFSPAGTIITVALRQQDDLAIVEVTDKGVGLDAQDLAQVFKRYSLLKSKSTAGEEQGRSTLARAQQWAKAMGGELSATSPGEGHGCTFRLQLPKVV